MYFESDEESTKYVKTSNKSASKSKHKHIYVPVLVKLTNNDGYIFGRCEVCGKLSYDHKLFKGTKYEKEVGDYCGFLSRYVDADKKKYMEEHYETYSLDSHRLGDLFKLKYL